MSDPFDTGPEFTLVDLLPPVVHMHYGPPPWPIDILSTAAAFWWAFALFFDRHLMATNPTYTALRHTPQWMWAVLALCIALLHLSTTTVPILRRFKHEAMLVVIVWWLAVGILYLAGNPFALGGGVHLAIALGCTLRLRWRRY